MDRLLFNIKKSIHMTYKLIHDSIIEKAKNLSEVRKEHKQQGVYYERHHIVPRSFGGTNVKSNLVLLTAKEHYIIHRLLVEMQKPGTLKHYKMLNAFSFFAAKSTKHDRVEVSTRYYQEVKELLAEKRKGVPRPIEVIEKIKETKRKNPYHPTDKQRKEHSKRMTGEGNSMYGKTHSKEVRELLRKQKIGKKNIAISESNKRRAGKITSVTKAIIQIDKQGNRVNTYNTIGEAKRQTGIKSIQGALRGRWTYAGGFKWEYLKK